MKVTKTIVRCTLLSRPQCPKSWDALTPTGKVDVRSCSACGDEVHWVRTDEETIAHAELGHCIARERPDWSELPHRLLTIGRPQLSREDELPSSEQLRAEAWLKRERGIAEAILPSSMRSGKRCPVCSYPVPTFKEHCYVCGQSNL